MQRVAIAVVDGNADEPAAEVALHQAPMHLVEADEIEPRAPQIAQHVLEEIRRHLEQPVGLEPVGPRRPHVVQREDRPYAADERTHERGARR